MKPPQSPLFCRVFHLNFKLIPVDSFEENSICERGSFVTRGRGAEDMMGKGAGNKARADGKILAWCAFTILYYTILFCQ